MAEIALDSDFVTLDNLNLEQAATKPAAPATGRVRVYALADGSWVVQTPDGVEHVGGGGPGGGLTVREVDNAPSLAVTTLVLPNGTLTDLGGGEAYYTPVEPAPNVSIGLVGQSSHSNPLNLWFNGGTLDVAPINQLTYTPPAIGGGAALTAPPAASGFTLTDGANSALTDVGASLQFSASGSSTPAVKIAHVAVGATFTVTARVTACIQSGTSGFMGITLYDSATGYYLSFGFGGSYASLGLRRASTLSAAVNQVGPQWLGFSGKLAWLRIVQDASHRTFYISPDGNTWYQYYQTVNTDYLTPDKIGLGGYCPIAGTFALLLCDSWVLA